MLLYILLIVLLFVTIGSWDTSATKITILWLIGTAFIMLINTDKAASDKDYFRKTILKNLKLTLVLEFVINLYSFPLIIELIIIPTISFMVMISVFIGSKAKYKQMIVSLNYALGLFGITLLIFTFYKIANNPQDFATLHNLRNFLLPPTLTIAFLPFVYMVALFMTYRDVFIRIRIANRNSELHRNAKWKIFQTYRLNLRRLNRLSKEVSSLETTNMNDMLTMILNRED